MNLRRTGAIALAVALSMAACATGVGDERVAVSDPLPADDVPIPVEPGGGIGDGGGIPGAEPDAASARVVEPHPGGADDPRARPWERVVPNGDQTELTVFWASGVAPCTVLDRVEVDETDEAVTITVYEGSDPAHPDGICIDIAEYKAYTVQLGAELGPRSIVDGGAEKG